LVKNFGQHTHDSDPPDQSNSSELAALKNQTAILEQRLKQAEMR
jgi:hypothetical protein